MALKNKIKWVKKKYFKFYSNKKFFLHKTKTYCYNYALKKLLPFKVFPQIAIKHLLAKSLTLQGHAYIPLKPPNFSLTQSHSTTALKLHSFLSVEISYRIFPLHIQTKSHYSVVNKSAWFMFRFWFTRISRSSSGSESQRFLFNSLKA